jgi:hypothetical protein
MMRKALPGIAALALGLALASCAGPSDWIKQGASPAQASDDYADCRAETQHDIQRDVNIDTDIAASMQQNWQHSQSTATHLAGDAAIDNDRTKDLLKICMEDKGYAPNGSRATSSPGWWTLPDL